MPLEDYELPTDPYPEPLDGCDLLDEIVAIVSKYTVLPPHAVELLALWTVATHALHPAQFLHAPRLLIVAPTPDSGKSTLMTLLCHLVSRPENDSSPTEASLVETIDAEYPTVFIDESDTIQNFRSLINVLNSGHYRPQAFKRKMVYDRTLQRNVPTKFSTFAMVCLGGIGEKWIPPALRSRSYLIGLQPRMPDDAISEFHIADAAPELRVLRSKIIRWTADNIDALRAVRPQVEMINRIADNAKVLCAVSDVAGGVWPQRARDTIERYTPTLDGDPRMLLAHIRELICDPDNLLPRHKVHADGLADPGRVWSAELCDRLRERVDWPYRDLKTHDLARDLRPFGVRPDQSQEGGRGSRKGQAYRLRDLVEPFARCRIPPIPPAQIGRLVDRAEPPSTGLPVPGEGILAGGKERVRHSNMARARNESRWNGRGSDWATSPDIFDPLNTEFHFTLDVAASDWNAKNPNYYTEDDDGLRQDWASNVCWCNPPYGAALADWMKKAYDASQAGATVVALIPVSTDRPWWTEYVMKGKVRYLLGRPRFLTPEGEWQELMRPSAIVVFRPPVDHDTVIPSKKMPRAPRGTRRIAVDREKLRAFRAQHPEMTEGEARAVLIKGVPQYKPGDRVWVHYGRGDRQLAEIVAPTGSRYMMRKYIVKTESWRENRQPIAASQIIGLAASPQNGGEAAEHATDATPVNDRSAAAVATKPNGVDPEGVNTESGVDHGAGA